jgi:hypothetical protein
MFSLAFRKKKHLVEEEQGLCINHCAGPKRPERRDSAAIGPAQYDPHSGSAKKNLARPPLGDYKGQVSGKDALRVQLCIQWVAKDEQMATLNGAKGCRWQLNGQGTNWAVLHGLWRAPVTLSMLQHLGLSPGPGHAWPSARGRANERRMQMPFSHVAATRAAGIRH